MMAASCTNRGVGVLPEILSRTRKHEREGVKDPSRPYGVKLWPRCILYILLMHHHVLCSQMLKTNVVKVMQYYSFLNIISFHMYNSRCNIFLKCLWIAWHSKSCDLLNVFIVLKVGLTTWARFWGILLIKSWTYLVVFFPSMGYLFVLKI